MSEWKDVAHFLYGRGFWYADPLREINGLTEEQLYWVPDPNSLCILWHVGHIAHRERSHIGIFLQGLQPTIIPIQFEVFGCEWCSTEKVRQSVDSVESVFEWVREVRKKSHDFIVSLSEDDFHAIPPTSEEGLSVAHWLFITTAHTALHIGRIQLLRALIEGKHERVC
ncbi:DinB family protein [candidate division WOR-3 bacterium]|nr:DinB family protein [candidate division WOR-3 bacterium]